MIKKFIAVIAIAAMLPACAGGYATGSYAPVIDVYGSPGKNPDMYAGELNLCQQLAASRPQEKDAAKGAAVGAAGGAAAGALTGLVRGKSIGAATGYGALAGVLVGGGTSLYQANQNRQNLVMNCMGSRGWHVLGR